MKVYFDLYYHFFIFFNHEYLKDVIKVYEEEKESSGMFFFFIFLLFLYSIFSGGKNVFRIVTTIQLLKIFINKNNIIYYLIYFIIQF